MPINTRLISGHAPISKRAPFLTVGGQLTLSRGVTTTSPDRQTYPKGTTGWAYKIYGNGVILHMADGKKIPASFDFLDIPKPAISADISPMPLPYQAL